MPVHLTLLKPFLSWYYLTRLNCYFLVWHCINLFSRFFLFWFFICFCFCFCFWLILILWVLIFWVSVSKDTLNPFLCKDFLCLAEEAIWKCENCHNSTLVCFAMQCLLQSWLSSRMQTLFFVAFESRYILQQPVSLKILVIWTYIYALRCSYYKWIL